MKTLQVCELKAYLGFDNIDLTEADIPPIHHLIKAANRGHRDSALTLLKAAGGALTNNQPLPETLSTYPGYIASCLAKIKHPKDKVDAAFNLKSTGQKEPSSAIFQRNLRNAIEVQTLVQKEGISETKACKRVSKTACRGESLIEKINVKHRAHAKQLLAIKQQMEAIFYKTADSHCKLAI